MRVKHSDYLFPSKIYAKVCSVPSELDENSVLEIMSQGFGINDEDIQIERGNSITFLWKEVESISIPAIRWIDKIDQPLIASVKRMLILTNRVEKMRFLGVLANSEVVVEDLFDTILLQLNNKGANANPISLNLLSSNVEYISRRSGIGIHSLSVDHSNVIEPPISYLYVESYTNIPPSSYLGKYIRVGDEVDLSTIGFSVNDVPLTLSQEMLIIENADINFEVLPSLIRFIYETFRVR
jgi:hypothetical protein